VPAHQVCFNDRWGYLCTRTQRWREWPDVPSVKLIRQCWQEDRRQGDTTPPAALQEALSAFCPEDQRRCQGCRWWVPLAAMETEEVCSNCREGVAGVG